MSSAKWRPSCLGLNVLTILARKGCLLKLSSECIAQPLSVICNLSLSEGIFPHEIKTANVILLYISHDSLYLITIDPCLYYACFLSIGTESPNIDVGYTSGPFDTMNYFLSCTCLVKCGMKLPNTLRPRQNCRRFPDDIFKCIFLNENIWFPINISLKFVPRGRIDNIPALVQVMAWRRPGDKPLFEPTMVRLLTHICVARPQWVKPSQTSTVVPLKLGIW